MLTHSLISICHFHITTLLSLKGIMHRKLLLSYHISSCRCMWNGHQQPEGINHPRLSIGAGSLSGDIQTLHLSIGKDARCTIRSMHQQT